RAVHYQSGSLWRTSPGDFAPVARWTYPRNGSRRLQATLIEKWRGYFFAPSEPFNLGMCRLLITGTYLVSLLIPEAAIGAEFVELARLPHYAWHPHSYYRLFDNYPLSPDVTSVLYWGWLGALLCTALGFYTRTSSAIAALLTIFFGGMV